jgi:hypothetical protein
MAFALASLNRLARIGLVGLAGLATPVGCTASSTATHVFVRDPRQVWVEAASVNGEEVVLPPGEGLRGVRIREGEARTEKIISYATILREPGGAITVEDRLCAPWATSPLSAKGELRVMKGAGEEPFVSDGVTVRVSLVCDGPRDAKVEIDFVTPWTNVREIRIVKGEPPDVPASSTHPALQRQDWHE